MDAVVQGALSALRTRLEVREVVSELVDDVEEWFHQVELAQSRSQSDDLQLVAVRLARRIRTIQAEKQQLQNEMKSMRLRASEVRAKFAADISSVLAESRNAQTLRSRVKDMESTISQLKTQNSNLIARLRLGQGEANLEMMKEEENGKNLSVPSPPGESTGVVGAEEQQIVNDQPPASVLIELLPPPSSTSPPPPPKPPTPPVFCLLSDISEEVLLMVFSFLDTGEVLATAQCNRFVFQRVDKVFGTDSAIIKPEWAIRYPQAQAQTQHAAAGMPGQMAASSDTLALGSHFAGINGGSSTVSTMAGGGVTASTNTSTSTNTISTAATTAAAATKQFLQNLMDAASGAGAQPVQLSRDLTEILSRKLSGGEMRAVQAVGDALKKQTADNEQLRAEKDDLAARLANTENVRDFLVQKLRSAEVALKATMKESGQLRRQALADGEIISFLDLRGQELELQSSELVVANKQLQASYNLQQGTFAQVEKRLGSELIDTRSRLEEAESSFKAQKKLLVKEVKSLRANLEVVTKERNIFGAQIRVLKDTLDGISR